MQGRGSHVSNILLMSKITVSFHASNPLHLPRDWVDQNVFLVCIICIGIG